MALAIGPAGATAIATAEGIGDAVQNRRRPGPRQAAIVCALSILSLIPPIGSSAALAQTGPDCSLRDGERHTLVRVIDGDTLVIDGGVEVRLIGALAPRASDAAGDETAWAPAAAASAGLEKLVRGQHLELGFAGRRSDRYGRLLAQVFAIEPTASPTAGRVWVQGEMLRGGLSRAYALDGSIGCLAELIAQERIAREGGIGIWDEPAYAVRDANSIDDLLSRRGTFQLVHGTVRAVSDLKTTTYINFGEDVRQDFTISIRGQARRQMLAAGFDASRLTGQTVRVRGWIERRGGPLIELHDTTEIETNTESGDGFGVAGGSMPGRPTRRRSARSKAAE